MARDVSGKRYGRLVVLGRAENIGRNSAWQCRCDCGNFTIVLGANLGRHTKSCGCLYRDTRPVTFKKKHKYSNIAADFVAASIDDALDEIR